MVSTHLAPVSRIMLQRASSRHSAYLKGKPCAKKDESSVQRTQCTLSMESNFQIKNKVTSCILVHLDHVETTVDAAHRAGLDKDRIFQFSDRPCPAKLGIQDWRAATAGTQPEGMSISTVPDPSSPVTAI